MELFLFGEVGGRVPEFDKKYTWVYVGIFKILGWSVYGFKWSKA